MYAHNTKKSEMWVLPLMGWHVDLETPLLSCAEVLVLSSVETTKGSLVWWGIREPQFVLSGT